MNEKILAIGELDEGGLIGYRIITTAQTIDIGIGKGQSCCESFGYLTSEDDLKDFIGADLLEVVQVDTELNSIMLEKNRVSRYACIFINLNTSKGTLQFAVYNEHNGYYGHMVKVTSKQLTLRTDL